MRWSKYILASLFVLFPLVSSAIGLGDITLNSYLNDPLRATIPILQQGDTQPGQLKVRLASRSEYNEMSLDRSNFLAQLTLSIDSYQNGQAYISVTSSEPVIEPVLIVLVELISPEGKLLRSYTLFFDPPQYSERVVVAAAPSMIKHKSQKELPSPVIQKPTKKVNTMQKERRFGPAKSGQSLWAIAKHYSRHNAANIQQAMWAIYQRNPRAFVHDNINGLRTDRRLVIPSNHVMEQVNRKEATREINKQNIAWQNRILTKMVQPPVETTDNAIVAAPTLSLEYGLPSAKTAPDKEGAEHKAKPALPLLMANSLEKSNKQIDRHPPVVSMDAVVAPLSESSSVTIAPAKIQNENASTEMAVSEDTLSVSRKSNHLLIQHIQSLEEKLKDQHHMMKAALKQRDEEIERLAKMLEDKKIAIDMSAKPGNAAGETTLSQKKGTPLEEAPSMSLTVEPAQPRPFDSTDSLASKMDELETESIAIATPDIQVKKSVTSIRLIILVLIFVLLAISLGVFFFRRSHRSKIESADRMFEKESEVFEKLAMDEMVEENQGVEETLSSSVDKKAKVDTEGPTDSEIDPIEKAQVLMAYGRYEQAISILHDALKIQPDEVELLVLLLECYAMSKDRPAYEKALSQLPNNLKVHNPTLFKKVKEIEQSISQDVLTEFADEKKKQQKEIFSSVAPEEAGVINFSMEEVEEEMQRVKEKRKEKDKPKDEQAIDFTNNEDDGVSTLTEENNATKNEVDPFLQESKEQPTEPVTKENIETKINLARVYIEMGDEEEARNLLEEVLQIGNEKEQAKARELLGKL